MKDIIIKFEPFVFKQNIFIRDNETGEVIQECVPQKEITSYISLLKDDIEKVHFFGNKDFAEKIKAECLTQYNLNNLDIIINN